MKMTVKAALTSDAEAIAGIHRASRKAAMEWLPVLHTPQEDLWFFQKVVLAKEDVRVAQVDGETVGFAAINGDWLNHLYVHPDHWRRGIGHLLTEKAQAARQRLQLWTFQRNAMARAFYAAHGFEDREPTDGQGNEEKMPDVRMVWTRAASGVVAI